MKVLQFSGGKDSLACLYLLKAEWETLPVVWLNTGAAYPETISYMEKWKNVLPNFIEIKSDQPSQIAKNGYPSDIVVVNNTSFGRQFFKSDAPLVQSYLNCCAENVWLPLFHAIDAMGATEIVRGQRRSDARQSSIRHGDVVNGKKYNFPIYDWSDEKVFSYLKAVGAEIPEGYRNGEKTGRDCWDCTAYLDENAQRIKNLPEVKKQVVLKRLSEIRKTIAASHIIQDYGDEPEWKGYH